MRTSRRNFLKTTAAFGAGMMIVSDLLAQDSPNEKIAFASIGIGGRGQTDSDDANNFGQVVAYCDTNRNQLKGGSRRFPKAKAYEDYRTLFDEMGDSIDAITVSTTDHMHAIIAATGMKLGKHCYCEKPLTRTIYEARRLGEIAAEKNVVTQMGNQGSAELGLREGAALLRAGVIGEVKEVYCWTNRPVWPQGGERGEATPVPAYLNWQRWLGTAPERPYVPGAYDPFAWRGWWDFGSGALGDMACHTLNVGFAGLEIRDPQWVEAITSGHNHDSLPKWSKITFQFPENSWRPGFKMYWLDGGQRPDPALLDGEAPGGSGLLIIGTKGKYYSVNDYGKDRKLMGVDAAEADALLAKLKSEGKVPDAGQYGGHFGEFVAAIKKGDRQLPWSKFPEYAGPLTETILLGNLAVWAASEPEVQGQRINWDAKKLEITGDVQDRARLESLVKPNYQNGYENI